MNIWNLETNKKSLKVKNVITKLIIRSPGLFQKDGNQNFGNQQQRKTKNPLLNQSTNWKTESNILIIYESSVNMRQTICQYTILMHQEIC